MSDEEKSSHPNDDRRSTLDAVIDSTPAIVGFASLVGTFVFFVVTYAISYMFAMLFAFGYEVSGREYIEGLRYLDGVASNSVASDSAENIPSWYLLFLMVTQIISVYVAGRVAGKLAPEKEYLSSLALIVLCYGLAIAFSMPGINQPVWWKFLEIAVFVATAFAGAYHARRRNIIYP